MTATEHAAVASIIAVAGLAVKRLVPELPEPVFWLTYAGVAFLSHFLLDAIPHGHSFNWGHNSFQKNKKEFWLEAGPVVLSIIIVFPILIVKQGFFCFLYYFWGMLCSNIPDILMLKFKFFQRLNRWCHWFEKKGKPLKNGWHEYIFRYALVAVWFYFFLR